jgi:hypothetical protein
MRCMCQIQRQFSTECKRKLSITFLILHRHKYIIILTNEQFTIAMQAIWRPTLTVTELPIPITTKIKIQWIPGNKVLWCCKGL